MNMEMEQSNDIYIEVYDFKLHEAIILTSAALPFARYLCKTARSLAMVECRGEGIENQLESHHVDDSPDSVDEFRVEEMPPKLKESDFSGTVGERIENQLESHHVDDSPDSVDKFQVEEMPPKLKESDFSGTVTCLVKAKGKRPTHSALDELNMVSAFAGGYTWSTFMKRRRARANLLYGLPRKDFLVKNSVTLIESSLVSEGTEKSMELSGIKPNIHACNSLFSCLLRKQLLDNALKDCKSALKLFFESEEDCKLNKDFDVVVYNTMISVCCKVNNWVEAERLWRCLKESNHAGTKVTYSLLVSVFVCCSRNDLALDAYYEMTQNGLKPGDDTMQAVMSACTKEGKWDLTVRILQDMLERGLKPKQISLGKAGANRCADALRVFESIKVQERSTVSFHLYDTAMMSCQKLGLWDKALQLLWQMEASGQLVSAESYNLVTGASELARNPKVALQVYEHMIHQNRPADTLTHLSLIRAFIWGSLGNKVEEILDVSPNASICNAYIHGMCLRDGKTRALMLQYLSNDTLQGRGGFVTLENMASKSAWAAVAHMLETVSLEVIVTYYGFKAHIDLC
ncbi:Pentatricopeptide repeat [Dillenia turbinata]|uniref:Pentatricopeptide repeat n=1 Tax=Dillenia turbinata TaxID=194707 RepID=A0AAN8V4B6_9MAGN